MKNYHACQFTTEPNERELRNKKIAYDAALEGIVLLKNDGALPVISKKLALYGAGAKYTIKGGTGSGEVNERKSVGIYEGLINAGFEVSTKTWLEDYDVEYVEAKKNNKFSLAGGITNILSDNFLAPYGRPITDKDVEDSDCDTAIYVVNRQAGEGGDKKIEKGEFDLSKEEIANVKKMAESYKNSILVINSGSYMNLSVLDEADVSAVIFYCQQGMEGGTAFADLISGKENFSAKLTDSWAKEYDDLPFAREYSYLSGDTTQEYYKEGIYVGYRYFDTFKVLPRYHFGYGLSYTDFDLNKEGFKVEGDKVTLSVNVKNVGKVDGKEVVEVYCSCPDGKLKKEYQRLVGYKKTAKLQPEESQTVEISFGLEYLASYCEECASYVLEKGDYILRVGKSSVNTQVVGVLTVDENIVISKHEHVCVRETPVEELGGVDNNFADDLEGVEKIAIKASDYVTKVMEYKTPDVYSDEKIDGIMATLSVEEMVDICVGGGNFVPFTTNKYFTPGTVGRTTDKLYHKGIIHMNLADGPAGLRLTKESGITPKGKMSIVDGHYPMGWMSTLPKFLIKLVFAPFFKEGDTKLYQYTTAFPVGTALAQSWNDELCENIGKAVGDEMDEYNISYWLAPAMNIHKNPLCGRNFEYFSEDPVLTGKVAAAITRGVQSKSGNYATIKHFACNNVEDNRTKSNSNLNERALREIYLKGFEICVKESDPKSVMTSYNLVNGTYTPNSYDLCTKVLRNEWGFDGVVMTDWLSTAGSQGKNDIAIKIGNDMIMPGGKSYQKKILNGLKKGTLTLEDIKRATANILRQIIYSRIMIREENPLTPDIFE